MAKSLDARWPIGSKIELRKGILTVRGFNRRGMEGEVTGYTEDGLIIVSNQHGPFAHAEPSDLRMLVKAAR